MDPSSKIETEHGYQQNGHPLDYDSMTSTLREENASGADARRARVLSTVGLVLASVGGGLIGWPLGEKLGGSQPHWALAYVGIPISISGLGVALWSDSNMRSAVEAHNRSLAGGEPQH